MKNKKRILAVIGTFLILGIVALNLFLSSIYRLPILTYHSIDYTADAKDRLTVSPENFARQMKYLRDFSYNVIPLEKAVWYIANKKRPPRKTVAITMDDGYRNNYTNAYPAMKKYNIPVTIFVITGKIGRPAFMDWDEVGELARSGVVDIESHTKSHKWITGLDDGALKDELEDSKKIIEENTGREVKFICYPMGGYDGRVKEAAKAAGYKAGFATKPTRFAPNYDVYEIKRIRISPTANNLFVFGIKVSGYHAFFKVLSSERRDDLNI